MESERLLDLPLTPLDLPNFFHQVAHKIAKSAEPRKEHVSVSRSSNYDQKGLNFDEILAGGELTRTNPKRY
jgi:hypothetical protein